MEEEILKEAIAAISNGEFSENDIKSVKDKMKELNKKELAMKRQMEKDKNAFVKAKGKSTSELKSIRKDIKDLKLLLKNIR